MSSLYNNMTITKQQGFSLLEVMVAFAILTTAFISLAGVFPAALSINKGAENISVASFIAQDKIEEINSTDYTALATGTIEIKHRLSTDPSNYLYNFERETSIHFVDQNLQLSLINAGLKMASTTVYYTDGSKNQKNYKLNLLIILK